MIDHSRLLVRREGIVGEFLDELDFQIFPGGPQARFFDEVQRIISDPVVEIPGNDHTLRLLLWQNFGSKVVRVPLVVLGAADVERVKGDRDADGFGDTGIVRILSASDLSELGTFDPDLTQFDIDWNEFTIPLPGTAIGQSIIIEFKFTSDISADNFSGWSIDNVEINLQ